MKINSKYKRRMRSHRTTLRLVPKYLNAYIYIYIYVCVCVCVCVSVHELKYLIHYTASCFFFSNYFYLGLTGSRDKAVHLIWVAAQNGWETMSPAVTVPYKLKHKRFWTEVPRYDSVLRCDLGFATIRCCCLDIVFISLRLLPHALGRIYVRTYFFCAAMRLLVCGTFVCFIVLLTLLGTLIPRLTSDPANEFFG